MAADSWHWRLGVGVCRRGGRGHCFLAEQKRQGPGAEFEFADIQSSRPLRPWRPSDTTPTEPSAPHGPSDTKPTTKSPSKPGFAVSMPTAVIQLPLGKRVPVTIKIE